MQSRTYILFTLWCLCAYVAYQFGLHSNDTATKTPHKIEQHPSNSHSLGINSESTKPVISPTSTVTQSPLSAETQFQSNSNQFEENLMQCEDPEKFTELLLKQFKDAYWLDYYDDLNNITILQKAFSKLPHEDMLQVLSIFARDGAHHGYNYDFNNMMFDAAVKSAPEATLDYLLKNDAKYPGEHYSILEEWAKSEPDKVLAWMKNSNSMMAEDYYSSVFNQLAKKDLNLASEQLFTLDQKHQKEALRGIISSIDNFEASLDFAQELKNNPHFSESDYNTLISTIAQENPEAALSWIDESKQDKSAQLRQDALKRWMRNDPEAAKDWLLNQNTSAKAHQELAANLPGNAQSLSLIQEKIPQDKRNETLISFLNSGKLYNQNVVNDTITLLDTPEMRHQASLDYFEKIKNHGAVAQKFLKANTFLSSETKTAISRGLHVPLYKSQNGSTYYGSIETSESPQLTYENLKKMDPFIAEEYLKANSDKITELAP